MASAAAGAAAQRVAGLTAVDAERSAADDAAVDVAATTAGSATVNTQCPKNPDTAPGVAPDGARAAVAGTADVGSIAMSGMSGSCCCYLADCRRCRSKRLSSQYCPCSSPLAVAVAAASASQCR